MNRLFRGWKYNPPSDWIRITALDMHTGGEPLRVFTSGLPEIEGNSVLEKRRFFRENFDYIRTGTMWEPRGHADMYGAILTPSADADFDVFFLHNEGYSTMCGHAIIALTKLVLETGIVVKEGSEPQLTINVPAGRVHATASFIDGKASNIRFRNVPSFLYLDNQDVEVPGIGKVYFDVAYGGAFYAFVDADQIGSGLQPDDFNRLVDIGKRIKKSVMENFPIIHPLEEELSFLYGVIFTGKPLDPLHHSRNVCIFADGEVDRSATGSGVSARAALHFAKGELSFSETITIESILGTTMTVRVAELTQFGGYNAVIPEVGGTASITGQNEFYFDPEDELNRGFIFR